jgi:protein tyrosine phosphatase (PTP) superfamily phosphohydrolase (DUF442 family)
MNSFRKTFRSVLAALVITLAVCSGAPSVGQPQAAASHKTSASKKLKLTGVANFGEVTPTLYRGAQPSRVGYESLAHMGIDIVVDTRLSRKGSEKKAVNGAGMQYVSIPWHCWFPRDKAMVQFLQLLRDNPGKKVFVHCRYGDDRTGMMIAAYRMAVDHWTAAEARQEMNQFEFNRKVCYPLQSYERKFEQRLKKDKSLREAVAEAR